MRLDPAVAEAAAQELGAGTPRPGASHRARIRRLDHRALSSDRTLGVAGHRRWHRRGCGLHRCARVDAASSECRCTHARTRTGRLEHGDWLGLDRADRARSAGRALRCRLRVVALGRASRRDWVGSQRCVAEAPTGLAEARHRSTRPRWSVVPWVEPRKHCLRRVQVRPSDLLGVRLVFRGDILDARGAVHLTVWYYNCALGHCTPRGQM